MNTVNWTRWDYGCLRADVCGFTALVAPSNCGNGWLWNAAGQRGGASNKEAAKEAALFMLRHEAQRIVDRFDDAVAALNALKDLPTPIM